MKLECTDHFKSDELTNKVILVTGANRGIGKATSFALARAGANVILLGRDLAGLEDVYDEMMAEKLPEPIIHGFDLEGATHEHYVDISGAIDKAFGRLDGLIHNAAILGALSPIEHFDIKLWFQTIQINLNAPFLLTQFCLPLLKKSTDGRILFMSSGLGRVGQAYWGAYSASKFAIEGLMQVLAEETSSDTIKVNSLAPGIVHTAMFKQAFPAKDGSQYATPAEISNVFVYLMSKQSAHIHGEALTL